MQPIQRQMPLQGQETIKNKTINAINMLSDSKNDLENMVLNEDISNSDIEVKEKQIELFVKTLKGLLLVNKDKNIEYTPQDIQKYGYNPLQKAEELINRPIAKRDAPIFKLNYDYDVTFINLRDIRFSQSSISLPFKNETDDTISSSMDNYPFKFYNYDKNNLILLGMFGENDYMESDKTDTSHAPTVPSLNVVKFSDSNCYVSIDNRRIELLYRQLCLLLSVDPKWCTIDNMMFKNTNDFLRFDLGIPDDVHIYIPCCVKPSDGKPPRQMKTPEGVQLEKFNKELGFPLDKIDPIYAGVIWQRVTTPYLDKFRSDPLSGIQSFPSTSLPINSNAKLNNDNNIKIYKNKYQCRKGSDIEKGPISVSKIINDLIQNGKIQSPNKNNITETNYKNLQTIYYNAANIFINYVLNGSAEFKEFITFDNLYNNSLKLIPDFEQWKINIDKIPLYPDSTGGKRSRRRKISGGETRKRCQNGYRKNPQTKKCVKKNEKTKKSRKGPHFRIGVDFGGVLARHSKPGEEVAPVKEHKNTNIDMPGAVENLHKLKKKGHELYIVSFCGKKRALEGMNEIKEEGLEPVFTEQIYIGNPYEKSVVLNKFGCNFMIDDRIDLLDVIKKKAPNTKTIWFGQTQDKCKDKSHICAETWDDVYKIINSAKGFNVPKQDVSFAKFLAIKPPKIIENK